MPASAFSLFLSDDKEVLCWGADLASFESVKEAMSQMVFLSQMHDTACALHNAVVVFAIIKKIKVDIFIV